MIFVWDFHLLNLSKVLGELGQEIEMHLYLLAKFTKCFKQVQQVKVLNKGHEDLCWPLIDTYKLAVYRQYLYLVIYRSHRRKKLSHFLGVILRPGWNHPYRHCIRMHHTWAGGFLVLLSLDGDLTHKLCCSKVTKNFQYLKTLYY